MKIRIYMLKAVLENAMGHFYWDMGVFVNQDYEDSASYQTWKKLQKTGLQCSFKFICLYLTVF